MSINQSKQFSILLNNKIRIRKWKSEKITIKSYFECYETCIKHAIGVQLLANGLKTKSTACVLSFVNSNM